MIASSRRYVQGFDGLRGLAIILVLLHHIQVFGRWRVGPEVFFMLSGFLTTRSLQGQGGKAIGDVLLSFYRRRILRLTPPLIALLAVLAPIFALAVDGDEGRARDLLAAASYTINWQQALTSWESHSLAHLWSLAAEQQFYLVWPLVFLLCPRRMLQPLLVALAAATMAWRFWLYAHGAGFNRIYFGFDTHADALLVGCLLALATVPPRFGRFLRFTGAASLALLTVAALVLPMTATGTLCAGVTAMTILTAFVISGIDAGGGWLDSVTALPPLQAVGRMSYSLYLWNFPVIALCHPHWHHGVKALQLAVVGGVSAANYLLVEKPLARYLRMRPRTAVAEHRAPSLARTPVIAWGAAPSAS